MTQGVLLDAATHLTWSFASERDDMEGIQDTGGVLGAGQAMAFLLSLEVIQSRDSHPARKSSPRSANQVLMRGARPSWDQIQQAGRGMILPSRQVHDAGELTGPSSTSVLVMPHASHQPPAPAPPQNGQGHQMRLADTA